VKLVTGQQIPGSPQGPSGLVTIGLVVSMVLAFTVNEPFREQVLSLF